MNQMTLVTKILGIAIKYFSVKKGSMVSTFLGLCELKECNAKYCEALKELIEKKDLTLSKLRGIGVDNANVMTGVNNGVYAKLKEEVSNLIMVRCVCHSTELSVSHACNQALPRNFEFLAKET